MRRTKTHRVIIALISIVLFLAIYVGGYYSNREYKFVLTTWMGQNRYVEVQVKYRFAQQVSERLFWPVDKIDEWLFWT